METELDYRAKNVPQPKSVNRFAAITDPRAPSTADDLAETEEVRITPAIQAQAAALNNSPVKIHNWVRNNIEFIPSYGSIQGSDPAASLLIPVAVPPIQQPPPIYLA